MANKTEILFGDRIGLSAELRVGCAAVVFEPGSAPTRERRVLWTKRTDNGLWCLPGGAMDAGESASEACCREVLEETGLVVEVSRLVGVYSSPHRVTRYPDGNTVQYLALCFATEVVGGELGLSDETTDVGYYGAEGLTALDLMANHEQRAKDAWADGLATVVE